MLALVTLATEPTCDVVGFTAGGAAPLAGAAFDVSGISELTLSPRQRLDDAIRAISDLPFGATDRALPTPWAGARLAVLVLAADHVSVADPSDPGMHDIAGLDASVPTLLADFSRGTV